MEFFKRSCKSYTFFLAVDVHFKYNLHMFEMKPLDIECFRDIMTLYILALMIHHEYFGFDVFITHCRYFKIFDSSSMTQGLLSRMEDSVRLST